MIASMASLRANHAWKIWWSTVMGLQVWFIKEEQLSASAWGCAKHLTLFWATSLPLNWGDVYLMDRLLGGCTVWLVMLRELWSALQCVQVKTSDEWSSAEFSTGTSAIQHLWWWHRQWDWVLSGAVGALEGEDLLSRRAWTGWKRGPAQTSCS